MWKQITVIGAGLLGASLLQAVHQRKICKRTAVWSRSPKSRDACRKMPCCDYVADEIADAVNNADLIVICAPVEKITEIVNIISPALQAGTIVTDVGSVKTSICELSHNQLLSPSVFIGSHPMAGSEKTGLTHARADLFEGRPCFITPLTDVDKNALTRLEQFWQALGMNTALATPQEHDKIVAQISHLPHLLASTLCRLVADMPAEESALCGDGLRDTTRIAAGDASLWTGIMKQNQKPLNMTLDKFEAVLKEFRNALNSEDPSNIRKLLETAQKFREKL